MQWTEEWMFKKWKLKYLTAAPNSNRQNGKVEQKKPSYIIKKTTHKVNLFSENFMNSSLFLTLNYIFYVIFLLLLSNFLSVLRQILHLGIVQNLIWQQGVAEHMLAQLEKLRKPCRNWSAGLCVDSGIVPTLLFSGNLCLTELTGMPSTASVPLHTLLRRKWEEVS